MGKLLTGEQVAAYARDGYVSGIDILNAEEVAALERKITLFERHYRDEVGWAFDIKCNLLFDWVVDAGVHPRMLDAIEDLLGPNILMTDAVFRIKEPDSPLVYDWHQDSARIQVQPCFVIGFLAVSAATVDNGCLQAIPGTHHAVEAFDVVDDSPGQQLRRVARVRTPDTARAVPLVLGPGQAAFFSGNLIHASGPNRAPERRIAILYDYTAAHARQSVGMGSGQLVRGVDRWNYFGHEPLPEPGFTRANAAMRRRILRDYPENPLMGPREAGIPVRFPDAVQGPFAEEAAPVA